MTNEQNACKQVPGVTQKGASTSLDDARKKDTLAQKSSRCSGAPHKGEARANLVGI